MAKSGAGKSFAVKLEALRSMMMGTEVVIIDPENEYERLCDAVGGTYIRMSLNSTTRINPFDLPRVIDKEDGDNALRSNLITLHGLMRLMMGGALSPSEEADLDQALIDTLDAQYDWQLSKVHGLGVGAMYSRERARSESYGEGFKSDTDTVNVYVQDRIAVGPHLACSSP